MSTRKLFLLLLTFILSHVTSSEAQTVDVTPPQLAITSHIDGQGVGTPSIVLAGTATDSGRGDNGIAGITVNGVRASNDTAAGSGTANWSLTIFLSFGSNVINVTATDGSPLQNSTKVTITITSTVSPTASTAHLFPQFADGRFPDGTYYRTTLMISNHSDAVAASCSLQLRGLTLSNFALSYTLVPGGFVIAATDGTQDFQSGYASLQCNATVDAQLLYSYYFANGVKLSEATVFSSGRAPSMTLPADQREGAQLGLAIANDTDQSVTYTIAVRNGTGFMGSAPVTIGPRSSMARFLNQFVPGVPAESVTFVTVSSAGTATSIIGLRYTGNVFTTIPGTIVGAVAGQTSTYHVFPQFADGRFADGTSYRTTRIIVNPDLNISTDCATVLRGMTTDGTSALNVRLGARVTAVSNPTRGVQAFQSGYATTECSSIVFGELLYSYFDANGVKLSEATVFSSPSAQRVQILADNRGGSRLGLAIANDSDRSNAYTISFYNASGTVIATANQSLAGRSSVAKFIDELVSLPANYYGKVIVSSATGAASIIGLRFTGNVFTTIPQTIR